MEHIFIFYIFLARKKLADATSFRNWKLSTNSSNWHLFSKGENQVYIISITVVSHHRISLVFNSFSSQQISIIWSQLWLVMCHVSSKGTPFLLILRKFTYFIWLLMCTWLNLSICSFQIPCPTWSSCPPWSYQLIRHKYDPWPILSEVLWMGTDHLGRNNRIVLS